MKKEEIIEDYVYNSYFDFEKLIKEYYSYVYTIVKNFNGNTISSEDIEEIISDVFLAVWKNFSKIKENTYIKPYLSGISKNIIRNKYRDIKINYPVYDYEETIIDVINYDELLEEKEQENIIKNTLKGLKEEEYQVFIMFYYRSKKIKDIAKTLKISENKVKVILHRVRKRVRICLKNGGYDYGK